MFKQIYNSIFKIDNWVGLIGSFCIVVNMLIVVVNVVLRAVFNSPIVGFTDFAGMISCVIVVLTIAYTETESGHINVDFIVAYFPKTVQKILYLIMNLLNLTVVGVLAVCFWNYTMQSSVDGTVTMTAKLPYTPFLAICAFGMLLFALTVIVKTVGKLINWEGGSKE